jgi:hypothetical protein
MTHDLPGWRERRHIHFLAQRTPDPFAASFRRTRRQTKRRAEWVKPVIHGDQQVPLRVGLSPGFEYRSSLLLPHLPRQHLPKLEAGPKQTDLNRRDGTIYDRCDMLD